MQNCKFYYNKIKLVYKVNKKIIKITNKNKKKN